MILSPAKPAADGWLVFRSEQWHGENALICVSMSHDTFLCHLTAVLQQRGLSVTSEQRHETFQSLLRVSSWATCLNTQVSICKKPPSSFS